MTRYTRSFLIKKYENAFICQPKICHSAPGSHALYGWCQSLQSLVYFGVAGGGGGGGGVQETRPAQVKGVLKKLSLLVKKIH